MRAKASLASLVVNPLLKRELVGLLRTRRAFWLLVLLVASCSSLPLIVWPSQTDSMVAIRRSGVFIMFTMTQLVVAVLITPAFTAGAIAGERERGTYELLYTSLLSPFAIITAKLLASVGYVLILLAASAPAICLLYLQGGIDFSMIVGSYAITILAVLSSGLVCLTASMRSNRTLHAVIRGIFWVLFWQVGLMAVSILIFLVIWGGNQQPPELAMKWMFTTSPLPALVSLVERAPFGGRYECVYLYSAYAGVLSAVHFIYLLTRVRTPDFSSRRRRILRGKTARASTGVRRAAFAHTLLALGERDLPLFGNPVFMKEVRSEFFSRPWYRRLVTFGSFIVFGLVALAGIPFVAKIGMIGIITMVLSALLVSGTLASSLPKEIDQGNLDLLRVSLMPLWRILVGKAAAAVYGVWGILLAALFYLIVLPLVGLAEPTFFIAHYRQDDVITGSDALELVGNLYMLTIVVGVLHMIFLVAFSTFFTVVCRRTLSALLGTLMSLLAIYLGIPVIISLIMEVSHSRGVDILNFMFGTNPFMTWAMAVEGFYTEQLKGPRVYNSRYDPYTILAWFSFMYVAASCMFGGLAFALVRWRYERDR